MRKVKIITDSCADLNAEQLARYDIDYAKMSTVLDGVESPALLTWSEEEIHTFFDQMRNGKRITTSQVSAGEFESVFESYLREEYDIVYIACSLRLSGSVNTAHVVAAKLLEKYPEAKIHCIDSLNSSIGEGMLAIEASKLAKDGKGADEIAEWITSIRKNVREYVTVHSLEYLKRAGRVTASSAFFGNLMGVKPILVSDIYGSQAAMKKVKGRLNSLREIVALLKENIREPEKQTLYIVHTDAAKEDLDQLCEIAKSEIHCAEIHIGYIGPIVGASLGPDSVGIFAFGVKETFDPAEKK